MLPLQGAGGAGGLPGECGQRIANRSARPTESRKFATTPILTPCRMALRWENTAPTTHSLTPRPFADPHFFVLLKIPKKPEATGSAGRCEPVWAVHRPTPFNLLRNHTLSPLLGLGEMLRSAKELPAGLLFLLCLALAVSSTPPPGEGAGFRPSWVCRVCSARPQAAHAGPTWPVWGFAGVIKSHTGLTRAFLFSAHSSSTFPLRGKTDLSSQLSPANLHEFAHNRPPHGFNRAGNRSLWCPSLPRFPKPHTGPHRAEFGFYCLFLIRLESGRAAKSFSSL